MRKKLLKVTDPGRIAQMTYAEDEQTHNTSETGLAWTPVGAISTAVKVQEATSVMIYNDGASTAYFRFGPAAITAPVGAADGIPCPAKQTIIVNSGTKEYVIGTAATLFAYTAGNN